MLNLWCVIVQISDEGDVGGYGGAIGARSVANEDILICGNGKHDASEFPATSVVNKDSTA